MYQYLVEIGLKRYLDNYFFQERWIFEQYLENLNNFIASKSDEQKRVLRNKLSKITDHLSLNDHFHEIMVAYVFHPNGFFQDDGVVGGSSDIVDNGIYIEVKTINADPEEIERIKVLVPDSSRNFLPKDLSYDERFRQKFEQRITKAKEQINGSGIIYLVWDSTLVKEWSKRKILIENLLSDLIQEGKFKLPNIKIKVFYFGDLRDMIADPRASGEESVK